jgi:hypothetical protein
LCRSYRARPHSVAPTGQYGGTDPDGKKLTDGIVGSPYAGGTALQWASAWDAKSDQPQITVDLGQAAEIGVFRIHLTAGWPWWDALQGEVQDEVEVFTSLDGQRYASHGLFDLDVRRKDVPINHLLPDDETGQAWNFERLLDRPVQARYVRFQLRPRRILGVTEVQALEFIKYEPFDLRIALPDEK